jgi:F-type H+-transporting ATPase subunit gamma
VRGLVHRPWPNRVRPTFTMEPEALLASLVRQHLFVGLFRAAAHSAASEHAARLAAMQAAERNIEEHLEEMNAAYRHKRQESITEELLDVVAGFEALTTADDGGS